MATMNRHLESAPELVVVDNRSRDDPERAAREYRGQVRFMPLERNVGFGAACNIGVENASGSCVVMLNPDTELVDASLDELAAFALRAAGAGGPTAAEPGWVRTALGEWNPGGALALDRGDHPRPPAATAAAAAGPSRGGRAARSGSPG